MELKTTKGFKAYLRGLVAELLITDLVTLLDIDTQVFPGDCSKITHWHMDFKPLPETDGYDNEDRLDKVGVHLGNILEDLCSAWSNLSNNGKYYANCIKNDPFIDVYFIGKGEIHDDVHYKLQIYAWDFSLSFILTQVAL